VPIVAVVIGEGGSGGALAIGVGDRVLMLQYSIYSVISPEGCASILYKSADKAEIAAEAMGITAERLHRLKLVDEVIPEPLGGAHRDPQVMADTLKHGIVQTLAALQDVPIEALLVQRRKRIAGYGVYKEG
jgi:acetyl-CoA carboxylase carboxyl transferase subunit alpha